MKHEKTFERPDGSRVRIVVMIFDGDYQVFVWIWESEQWIMWDESKATPEEILEVKRELWLNIEPK